MGNTAFCISHFRYKRIILKLMGFSVVILTLLILNPITLERDKTSAIISEEDYGITVSSSGIIGKNLNPIIDDGRMIVKDYVTATTNSPSGYKLYIATLSADNKLYQNGNPVVETDNQIILPASGSSSAPAALTVSGSIPAVWGYAIPGLGSFDSSYNEAEPSAEAKFAAVPTSSSPVLIHDHSGVANNNITEVVYGFYASNLLDPGEYVAEVNYQIVTDVSNTVGGEMIITPGELPISFTMRDDIGTITLSTSLETNMTLGNLSATIDSDVVCSNLQIINESPLTATCDVPETLTDLGTHTVTLSIPGVGKTYAASFDIVYRSATLLAGRGLANKVDAVIPHSEVTAIKTTTFYAPEGFTPSDAAMISDPNLSDNPVYFVIDPDTKEMTIFGDVEEVYLNADSSHLLDGFAALTDISGFDIVKADRATNLSYFFNGDTALTNLSNAVYRWNTENVTNLSYFVANSGITTLSRLYAWNTENVTNLSHFAENSQITELAGLEQWDVGNVTDMSYAFANNAQLTVNDQIAPWRPTSIDDLSHLFDSTGITYLNPLEEWPVGTATRMDYTFNNTAIETVYGIRTWDTSNVTSMEGILSSNANLTSISDLIDWDVEQVQNLKEAFSHNPLLETLYGIHKWKTYAVTNLQNTFAYNPKLTNISALANWDTADVTNASGTFRSCTTLPSLTAIANWQMGSATDMSYMFAYNEALATLTGLEGWRTTSVLNLSNTFTGLNVTTLEALAEWTVSTATNMGATFSSCRKIADLHGLEEWEVNNVTNFGNTFSGCTKLSDLTALLGWETDSMQNTISMFSYNNSLKSLNGIQNFNTQNLTNMGWTFNNDTLLRDIEALRTWDVSKVRDMNLLFYNCESLSNLEPLSGWQTGSLQTMESAFINDLYVDGSVLNSWNTTSLYNMGWAFDQRLDPSKFPSWFTFYN